MYALCAVFTLLTFQTSHRMYIYIYNNINIYIYMHMNKLHAINTSLILHTLYKFHTLCTLHTRYTLYTVRAMLQCVQYIQHIRCTPQRIQCIHKWPGSHWGPLWPGSHPARVPGRTRPGADPGPTISQNNFTNIEYPEYNMTYLNKRYSYS